MHCCQIYSSWQSIETGYFSSFQAYFYAEAPDKQKLFGRITGKNYPLQFGREVMAHEKLLNMSIRVQFEVKPILEQKIILGNQLFIAWFTFTREAGLDCDLLCFIRTGQSKGEGWLRWMRKPAQDITNVAIWLVVKDSFMNVKIDCKAIHDLVDQHQGEPSDEP